MKKLFCLLLLLVCTVCFCSCNGIYVDDTKEQKAYTETITSLFNALDNRNADAVYDYLIIEGIIVRNRNRVKGCEGCLRITIGIKSENEKLINSLKRYEERIIR